MSPPWWSLTSAEVEAREIGVPSETLWVKDSFPGLVLRVWGSFNGVRAWGSFNGSNKARLPTLLKALT